MKRLSALLVSCILLLSCIIPAAANSGVSFAQPVPYDSIAERNAFLTAVGVPIPDDEARAGGLTCAMCVQGTLNMSDTVSAWGYTGNTRQCTKSWKEADREQSRTKVTTYLCDVCGYGFDQTSTETRWECNH